MIQVADGLYVGGIDDFDNAPRSLSIVSATQTIHYSRMGWSRQNRPDKSDPNYISYEDNHWLSLNWVDGDAYLYNWSGPETFQQIIDFIDREGPTLVHCDQGMSRSPTVAMLYMAKRGKLPENFQEARAEFSRLYPSYAPAGIVKYVEAMWDMVS